MSLQFSGRLSPQGTRLLPHLRSAAARGLSANQTMASLRAAGRGYRRTSFLTDFALLKGDQRKQERLRFIRKDRRPDPANLALARTTMLRPKAFVLEVRGSDADTGLPKLQHVTISSTVTRTVGEMEEMALAVVADRQRYPFGEADEALLVQGFQSGVLGTIL